MKRSLAVLFGLMSLQCFTPRSTTAQSSCMTSGIFGVVGYYQPPVGQTCQAWDGILQCWGYNANCAPATTPSEAKQDCPYCSHPVSLGTGNTFIEQTDLRVPGLGNGLALTRRWNSQWPASQVSSQVGLFGPNWRSTYEERVFLGGDNYMRYARADGSFWSFGMGGPGWMTVAPKNAAATLVQGSSYWTLTLKNGEQRRFDINSGSLIAIIDRNGNTTQISYDGTNRLVTVTDPASRHLTFTYPNGSSRLVTGVSSDVGISLTYAYDAQNRLSVVTKPDQTTLTFQYDSNSMITAVLDANGKVLESHTYDSNQRSLTSSRANGVEAVSITYH